MRQHVFTTTALSLFVPLLTGCVAAALVPLIPMATGTMEAGVVVTVDPSSMSQSTRSALQRAKTLGVVSIDRASIKAADLLETRGGYIVKIDRATAKQGEMTSSERREALVELCTSKGVDVGLLGHVTKTETNNTAMAALTGRAKTNLAWTMDVLTCNTRTPDTFRGTVVIDVGIYNGNPNKIEEAMGAEMGSKILEAIGRGGATKSGNVVVGADPRRATEPALKNGKDAQVKESVETVLPNVKENVPERTVRELSNVNNRALVQSIQKKLAGKGLYRGATDGLYGPMTKSAISRYQESLNMPVDGLPSQELLDASQTTAKVPVTPSIGEQKAERDQTKNKSSLDL